MLHREYWALELAESCRTRVRTRIQRMSFSGLHQGLRVSAYDCHIHFQREPLRRLHSCNSMTTGKVLFRSSVCLVEAGMLLWTRIPRSRSSCTIRLQFLAVDECNSILWYAQDLDACLRTAGAKHYSQFLGWSEQTLLLILSYRLHPLCNQPTGLPCHCRRKGTFQLLARTHCRCKEAFSRGTSTRTIPQWTLS